MQRYTIFHGIKYRVHGIRYQDLTLLDDSEEMAALARNLSAAAHKLVATDKSVSATLSRAARLLHFVAARNLFISPHLKLDQSAYAEFERATATEAEIRRDHQYRDVLSATRERGFVAARRHGPS